MVQMDLNRKNEQKWVFEGPFSNEQNNYKCRDMKFVGVRQPDKHVCMDNWEAVQLKHKGKPCVAYDLGVRDDAEFALTAIKEFGCVVRSYDPSPITSQWWENEKVGGHPWEKKDPNVHELKELEKQGKYKLYKQAATEKEGTLEMFTYNWDQVSTVRALEGQDKQQKLEVPAKSYSAMLKDNGDTHIDIMKVDIEGSEFAFLKGMFDQGCPQIEHLLFEWHSENFDKSLACPPEVKEMEDKFKKCGYQKYSRYPFWVVKKPIEEFRKFQVAPAYYGHSSYCLTCWQQLDNSAHSK